MKGRKIMSINTEMPDFREVDYIKALIDFVVPNDERQKYMDYYKFLLARVKMQENPRVLVDDIKQYGRSDIEMLAFKRHLLQRQNDGLIEIGKKRVFFDYLIDRVSNIRKIGLFEYLPNNKKHFNSEVEKVSKIFLSENSSSPEQALDHAIKSYQEIIEKTYSLIAEKENVCQGYSKNILSMVKILNDQEILEDKKCNKIKSIAKSYLEEWNTKKLTKLNVILSKMCDENGLSFDTYKNDTKIEKARKQFYQEVAELYLEIRTLKFNFDKASRMSNDDYARFYLQDEQLDDLQTGRNLAEEALQLYTEIANNTRVPSDKFKEYRERFKDIKERYTSFLCQREENLFIPEDIENGNYPQLRYACKTLKANAQKKGLSNIAEKIDDLTRRIENDSDADKKLLDYKKDYDIIYKSYIRLSDSIKQESEKKEESSKKTQESEKREETSKQNSVIKIEEKQKNLIETEQINDFETLYEAIQLLIKAMKEDIEAAQKSGDKKMVEALNKLLSKDFRVKGLKYLSFCVFNDREEVNADLRRQYFDERYGQYKALYNKYIEATQPTAEK